MFITFLFFFLLLLFHRTYRRSSCIRLSCTIIHEFAMELYHGAIEQNFEVIVPSSITGLIVKLGYTPIRKLCTQCLFVYLTFSEAIF